MSISTYLYYSYFTYRSIVPSMIPLPTLDVAINRLSQSLSQLTTSHATNTASMSHLADEREALESKEKEMRDMVEKAETKRSWFNAFREWVETVATFLDEKVCSTFTFMTMANNVNIVSYS